MPAITLPSGLTYQLTYLPAKDVLPPHLLVDYWANTYTDDGHMPEWVLRHVADRAAEWGADQELELCLTYVDSSHEAGQTAEDILAARRPKPLSLKQQALTALHAVATGANDTREQHQDLQTLRQALEALPD